MAGSNPRYQDSPYNGLAARAALEPSLPLIGRFLAIFGPKVTITNEMAGSGGDRLPWMFRKTGIGPLIGKRTWGGPVGHNTNPGDLLDGGFTTTPDLAFYSPDGTWDVENHGVPPDIEVEYDLKAGWKVGSFASASNSVASHNLA